MWTRGSCAERSCWGPGSHAKQTPEWPGTGTLQPSLDSRELHLISYAELEEPVGTSRQEVSLSHWVLSWPLKSCSILKARLLLSKACPHFPLPSQLGWDNVDSIPVVTSTLYSTGCTESRDSMSTL